MREIGCALITGGTGSFGRTMLRDLLARGVPEIRVLSRDEEKQHVLRGELRDARVRFHVGDVRDAGSVRRAMKGVDTVFHAAALKQVPSCEFFPIEAMRTNVVGSEHVVTAAIEAGARRVVCLSSDKAVFPISAMGITKALMEKIASARARDVGEHGRTIISCVRYGNVMASRGSVIPHFVRQIREGRPITVTHGAMTRFLMPLRDSVGLVHHAFAHARQGDLFVMKAPAATIADLAQALANLFGVPDHPVEVIGWRHAEKLYETLASGQELARAEDMGGHFRIPMDERDLNYAGFTSQGDGAVGTYEDYHSHNAERLDVAAVERLLLSLPEIRAELRAFGAAAGMRHSSVSADLRAAGIAAE